jgi:hypothetical protein
MLTVDYTENHDSPPGNWDEKFLFFSGVGSHGSHGRSSEAQAQNQNRELEG